MANRCKQYNSTHTEVSHTVQLPRLRWALPLQRPCTQFTDFAEFGTVCSCILGRAKWLYRQATPQAELMNPNRKEGLATMLSALRVQKLMMGREDILYCVWSAGALILTPFCLSSQDLGRSYWQTSLMFVLLCKVFSCTGSCCIHTHMYIPTARDIRRPRNRPLAPFRANFVQASWAIFGHFYGLQSSDIIIVFGTRLQHARTLW